MASQKIDLIYDVEDRPKFGKLLVYSLQQLLAVIAATLLVPLIVSGNEYGISLDPAAAMLGAGIGTLFYVLVTKRRSPVFLGSSFAFISALIGATQFGFWGIIIGGLFAGLVYTALAIIVKFVGVGWINKLMPPVVIGSTVALIGLSLSGSAISNLTSSNGSVESGSYNLVAILCGLVTFFVTVLASEKGGKQMKLIPFIIGIGAGYALASVFSIIGYAANVDYLKIVDYSALVNNFQNISVASFIDYPKFALIEAINESAAGTSTMSWIGLGQVAVLFVPVSLVVFAEHIADHKNLSSIIGRDLLKDPGLSRTLLGDGLGSAIGTMFGVCPNTTYGESVGCVAITKNASIYTIIGAACLCILISFFSPLIALIQTIPNSVLGGICLALYGFIAVSGLKMLKNVDLNEGRNLFVVSVILVAGIGGLALTFGGGDVSITITSIAVALILGILTNLILKPKDGKPHSGESIVDVPAADPVLEDNGHGPDGEVTGE